MTLKHLHYDRRPHCRNAMSYQIRAVSAQWPQAGVAQLNVPDLNGNQKEAGETFGLFQEMIADFTFIFETESISRLQPIQNQSFLNNHGIRVRNK